MLVSTLERFDVGGLDSIAGNTTHLQQSKSGDLLRLRAKEQWDRQGPQPAASGRLRA